MEFETKIVVRYAETDKMGVVYHANYLVWFEVARTEMLDSLGYPYKECEDNGFISPVLNCKIDYSTPLRYGDVALVKTSLIELSNVRSTFLYRVFREGKNCENEQHACVGTTTHCFIEESSFRPVNMRKRLPEVFSTYQDILSPQKVNKF